MNEQELAQALAQIRTLTAERDEARAERDQCRRERDEARALLAHSKTSLAEQFNDPMQGGEKA